MLAQVALVSGQAISNANSQQLGSSICRYVIHPAAALLLLLLLAPAHKTHVTTNTPPLKQDIRPSPRGCYSQALGRRYY